MHRFKLWMVDFSHRKLSEVNMVMNNHPEVVKMSCFWTLAQQLSLENRNGFWVSYLVWTVGVSRYTFWEL